MRVGIIAHEMGRTNGRLAQAWRAAGIEVEVIGPDVAVERLGGGDVALFRVDVLPTLDGLQPGLGRAPELRHRGVRILNPPWALIGAHDKLETARRLAAAGVPHPRSEHVRQRGDAARLTPPAVVKPRHGAWGCDVLRCDTKVALDECLSAVAARGWFERQGALVQELVPPPPSDVRVIVAGGTVVGAARREPAAGEWRTNISLGGRLLPIELDEEAGRLALRAAEAVGGDLVGVDLLPLPQGGYTVLELNGAADFDDRYSLGGPGVYVAAAEALALLEGEGNADDSPPRITVGEPAVEIRYSGELHIRPYRRGTYLGERHLEEVIEHALKDRYSFGGGWRGDAEIVIRLFDTRSRKDAA